MTTEDTQTARIKELEDRLARADELLAEYVRVLDELAEGAERLSDDVKNFEANLKRARSAMAGVLKADELYWNFRGKRENDG